MNMVYITGNIPQGNCINVKYLGDNHYECETQIPDSTMSVIFYAKVTGQKGDVLHLNIKLPPYDPADQGKTTQYKNQSFAPAAVETIYTSEDQRNWKRIEDAKLENWTLIFDVPLTANECYVSINLYYTIPMWEDLQRAMAVSPFVERKVVAHSMGGEEVVLFKVTDPTVPVSEKEIVYLQGAQHCAEFSGPNVLDGVLRFLADGLDEAGELLKKYEFHVVPIVEPTGWIRGQRGGYSGVNPNRDWMDFRLSQTKALDAYLRALPKKPFILIDIHNGWSSYEKDGAGVSVVEAFNPSPVYDAQIEFERMMKEECDYLSPAVHWRPQCDPSIFKDYAQKHFGFGFTFEFARFCIWDRALGKRVPISQARYRRFARQLVHAIDHFAKISLEKGWR
ncbi:MAG: hypothetical protein E7329_10615 [Clostridiales bacterium]|nr:hypothetical protein [Clostridiales bacterium]